MKEGTCQNEGRKTYKERNIKKGINMKKKKEGKKGH